jgi:hypothetical protein
MIIAFDFMGVNSRWELVRSPRAYAWNGAPRRWPGISPISYHIIVFLTIHSNVFDDLINQNAYVRQTNLCHIRIDCSCHDKLKILLKEIFFVASF